ncbi:MAG: hypothetical protein ACKV2O_07380 [Acidimicrobiales bacterium]
MTRPTSSRSGTSRSGVSRSRRAPRSAGRAAIRSRRGPATRQTGRARPRLRSKKLTAWRSKWTKRLKRSALALALVGVVLGVRLFAFPATDEVVAADAAVVFPSGGDAALQEALTLVNGGKAKALVLVGGSDGLCGGRGTIEVLCPASGVQDIEQVRVVSALVIAQGWSRVALITPRHQLSRTALLLERCTDAVVLRRVAPPAAGESSGQRFSAALAELPRYLAELTSDTACTT